MVQGVHVYALGERPRADDLSGLATLSSRAPADAAAIVLSGCLAEGSFVRSEWEAALWGIWRSSHVTVAHLTGSPGPDDAALLLLADYLVAGDSLQLDRWIGGLCPPRRVSLAEWTSLSVRADSADLAECLDGISRWPRDVLQESRAIARLRETAQLEIAIPAWLEARERLALESDV